MITDLISDWLICFVIPILVYTFYGFHNGIIYVSCIGLHLLSRIGDKLK